MVITVPGEIEEAVVEAARQLGVTPEGFVLDTLRARLASAGPQTAPDAWETLLHSAGSPAGVSLNDEATSREQLYD